MEIIIELLQTGLQRLADEIYGAIGGALFLGSWILQAWESKRARISVVSMRFFVIRALGCVLLAIESIRIDSFSLFLVTGGTFLLVLYNISLLRKNRNSNDSNDN